MLIGEREMGGCERSKIDAKGTRKSGRDFGHLTDRKKIGRRGGR
jgi:hypothetical protein